LAIGDACGPIGQGARMNYSIIVPAWNEEALLGDTLAALREAMRDVDDGGRHSGELIVVDNNSTDATADVARTAGARVVFEPVNQIARARNAGAAQASGEALVFIDADTTIESALLASVLERLGSGQVVGGGATIAADREVSGAAAAGLAFWNRISRLASYAAGCCVWCRRDAFESVGGFSTRVYAGEEIYLSRALKRWGRANGMRFEILGAPPVRTSTRKLDWYGPLGMARQAAMVFIPGALSSKRLMKTWYDDDGRAADRDERRPPD